MAEREGEWWCGVGWSDLVLFAIFEKRQFSADQAYFYGFIIYIKNNRPKENSKFNFLTRIFYFPKMGKTVLILTLVKKTLVSLEF